MTITLIVIFGAALFFFVVVMLMPVSAGAIARRRENQMRAQRPAGVETTIPAHSPEIVESTPIADSAKTIEKEAVVEPAGAALPYGPFELRLPRLPEPRFQSHFQVVPALPFPVSIAPAESPECTVKINAAMAVAAS